jgi:hypothetical protein
LAPAKTGFRPLPAGSILTGAAECGIGLISRRSCRDYDRGLLQEINMRRIQHLETRGLPASLTTPSVAGLTGAIHHANAAPDTRTRRSWVRTLSALLCVLLSAAVCGAGERVPFKASFHGFAMPPAPTNTPGVFEIVVPLSGQATHLGRFDEMLVHFLDFDTLAFTGFAEFTAANGDTFRTEFSGQAYPTDDRDWVTFDVTHTIVGGTGRFAGATGTLYGVDGRFNLATGEDVGGYTGTITPAGGRGK